MALIGIYGEHTIEMCPLNNPEVARQIVTFAESDPSEMLARHRIKRVVCQYHSALEHTFLWVVEAEDVHGVQSFCVEGGLAAFNTLKIVPLVTFADDVVPEARRVHGL